jgi:hypothetical protein
LAGDAEVFQRSAAGLTAAVSAGWQLCLLAGLAADRHPVYPNVYRWPGNDEKIP